MKREYFQILFLISAFCLFSCNKNQKEQTNVQQVANSNQNADSTQVTPIHKRLGKYVQVKLTSDLNGLSAK